MNIDVPQEFPELEPTTGTYIVPTLGLEESSFLFTYLGSFLSFITPHELPVDLLRDTINAKVSAYELLLQALKVESGFICIIAFLLVLSVIPLGVTIAWSCSRKSYNDEDAIESSTTNINSSNITVEESWEYYINCRRRILIFLLEIVIVLLIASITAMFITNEQIATAIVKTPTLVKASFKDAQIFIKDTHHQIIFSMHDGLTTATERVKLDLEEIDKLLGEPIQKQISRDTGIEVVFESMISLCEVNSEIIHRIMTLQDTLIKALQMSSDASTRLDELQIQLSVVQRQCTSRDRPLCDTLKLKSFDEMNILNGLKKLRSDPTILKMLTLGEVEIENKWRNLPTEITIARSLFREYPNQLKETFLKESNEIVQQLSSIKDKAHVTSRTFTSTARLLLDEIDQTVGVVSPLLDDLTEAGYLSWILGLVTTLFTLLFTLILLFGLSCGCWHSDNKAGVTLVVGAGFIAVGSIGLAGFSIALLLIGGHAEVFVCRPLYDSPNYNILERLLDRPGLIYTKEPGNGILGEILKPTGFTNGSLVNVSLARMLNECEINHSSYFTFELEKLINISKITDYREYPELHESLNRIKATELHLGSITKYLDIILETMINDSYLNLTEYRIEISQSTPERDIQTFTDQMQRVSQQIQDVATTSRMTTLGSRTKRLQTTIMQPLEQIRGDILYHLTALELQKDPWSQQINQSLTNLRTVQYFINRDASKICSEKSDEYIDRIKYHLDSNKKNLLHVLNKTAANCRPIYDIFNANRISFCRHTIDPLNGLWFFSFICLLLWGIASPITLMLASTYWRLKKTKKLRHSNSHQYGSPDDTIMISEQSNWTVPVPETPPEIDRSNW